MELIANTNEKTTLNHQYHLQRACAQESSEPSPGTYMSSLPLGPQFCNGGGSWTLDYGMDPSIENFGRALHSSDPNFDNTQSLLDTVAPKMVEWLCRLAKWTGTLLESSNIIIKITFSVHFGTIIHSQRACCGV